MVRATPALLAAFAACAHAFAPPGSHELALSRWIEAEGGFVGDISVGTHQGVRGLFATADVQAGALLVRIPKSCVLSADENPEWGLSLAELLTARLVGAHTRGEAGAYIESLPTEEPVSCDWSDFELGLLQSPHLTKTAKGMLPFLRESHERVLPYVKVGQV